MLDQEIEQLQAATLDRIQAAANLDDLEAVRVDVLGRKGSLSQFSKTFGKLTPEERSSVGKALNAAKAGLESALDAKKHSFADAVQQERLKGKIGRASCRERVYLCV